MLRKIFNISTKCRNFGYNVKLRENDCRFSDPITKETFYKSEKYRTRETFERIVCTCTAKSYVACRLQVDVTAPELRARSHLDGFDTLQKELS